MELHQERFEAWLFSQPKARIIEAANGTKCFLCSFVKETTSFENAFFIAWDRWTSDGSRTNYGSYGSTTNSKPIPAWAKKLIDPLWCNRFVGRCISAGEMQDRYRKLFPETTTKLHHEETRNELSAINPPPEDSQNQGRSKSDSPGPVLDEVGVDH